VGGMPNIPMAMLSAFIDVMAAMIAVIITVEVLLPKLIYTSKYSLFIGAYLLLVFLAGSTLILMQLKLHGSSLSEYRQKMAKFNEHYFYWFWADLIFGSYFLVFFLSSSGAAIRFGFDRVKAINRADKMEKEKLNAELDLLKNQINPHFLFNSLNTVYYAIDRQNTEARDSLQSFSNMLRYQLYDCDNNFIDIQKELLFLEQYITLQQKRLNKNYQIVCKGFNDIKSFTISPFLLLPLAENCFKHVSNYTDRENSIQVEVQQKDNSFIFKTFNTREPGERSQPNGIGVENVTKRLQLLYPGKHELTMKCTETSYEVNLKLECS
jgi:two-component system LytT family sensor kinase